MRTHFADSLDDLSCGLASMCGLTVTAMSEATAALLDADLRTAERVLDANTDLERAASDWEHKSFSLLALQAPVAHDLRFTVGGLHIAASLQRMGALAVHIAKIARLRHPTSAVPPEARAVVADMGRTAVARATETQVILRHVDSAHAQELVAADTVMDELHRRLFTVTQANNGRTECKLLSTSPCSDGSTNDSATTLWKSDDASSSSKPVDSPPDPTRSFRRLKLAGMSGGEMTHSGPDVEAGCLVSRKTWTV